jgi:hypothetical protein
MEIKNSQNYDVDRQNAKGTPDVESLEVTGRFARVKKNPSNQKA